ncbi:hypothetical protein ACFS7Z_19630 [Pontibacter toksunensis]|uniref:Uncharacterized protein n=1 Tax=Pontibacter toksunensis TaxID=1332631 RepID=A0ABW6C039_9BACT
MKAILFLLILLLPISYAQSQGVDEDLEKIERSLRVVYFDLDSLSEAYADSLIADKGVEHVIIFKSGSVGIIRPKESMHCGCEDNGTDTRLIWKQGQKYYLKRIRCCFNKVEEFRNIALYEELINDRSEIFSSTCKSNIKPEHYFFNTLTLITSEGKQEVSYIAEGNKYRQNCLKQATKTYIGSLSAEIYKH